MITRKFKDMDHTLFKIKQSMLKYKIDLRNLKNISLFGKPMVIHLNNQKRFKRLNELETIEYQTWLLKDPNFLQFLKDKKITPIQFFNALYKHRIIFEVVEVNDNLITQLPQEITEVPFDGITFERTEANLLTYSLLDYRINEALLREFGPSNYTFGILPNNKEAFAFTDRHILRDPTVITIYNIPYTPPSSLEILNLLKTISFESTISLSFSNFPRIISKTEYQLFLNGFQALSEYKFNYKKSVNLFKKSPMFLEEDDNFWYFKNLDITLDSDKNENYNIMSTYSKTLLKNQSLYICTSSESFKTMVPLLVDDILVKPDFIAVHA